MITYGDNVGREIEMRTDITLTKREDALFYSTAAEVITPFTPSGELDVDLLSNQINFMIDNKITGVFVNGLASEGLMMSGDDRLKALKTVVDTANGRFPVMANIIGNSTVEAVKDAKLYADAGADAVAITTPMIYKYTNDGFFEYHNAIANATDLPCYIYNEPATGNKLSPELVAKLFAANEAFKGYKDSTQNIIELQTLIGLIEKGRHFELLCGCDAQITTTVMLGGTGGISLISTIFPKLVINVVEAAERGDWAESFEWQNKLIKVRAALKKGPFMAAYKYAGEKVGNPLGKMKAPLAELNDKEKVQLDETLTGLGVY